VACFICVSLLTDAEGLSADLVGLLPGRATCKKRPTALAFAGRALPKGRARAYLSTISSFLNVKLEPLVPAAVPELQRTAEAVYGESGAYWRPIFTCMFPANPQGGGGPCFDP